MNDRSLLSVLLPARGSATFSARLPAALRMLLLRLGARSEAVQAEIQAMEQVSIAPTNNRRVLGCMRDAELALSYAAESGRYSNIAELEWSLTDHIQSPIGYQYPGELAVQLLSSRAHA